MVFEGEMYGYLWGIDLDFCGLFRWQEIVVKESK